MKDEGKTKNQLLQELQELKPRMTALEKAVGEHKWTENFLHIQHDLDIALSRSNEIEVALTHVLKATLKMDGVDSGWVFLTDEQTGELSLVSHEGLSLRFVRKVSPLASNEPTTQLIMQGEPYYGLLSEMPFEINETCREDGLRAVAILPIKHYGKVIAALNLGSHTHDVIPPSTQRTLKTLAAHVGSAVARVKAEEALRESEQKYRQLFFADSDAIGVLYADTLQFFEVNDAALRLYGYSREEFLNLRVTEISAEPESTSNSIQERSEGRPDTVPLRYHRKKDGTIFPVEISASTFMLRGRKVVCGVVRDISKRMQMEEALRRNGDHLELLVKERTADLDAANTQLVMEATERERIERVLRFSEQCNRLLIKNSSDLIITFDQDFTIRYIGPSVEKILGYAPDELLGQSGSIFLHPEDTENTMEAFSRCLNNPDKLIYIRHRGRHKDGSWRSLETIGQNLLDHPAMNGVLVNSRDITERKKLEAELMKIDKIESLGILAGGIAHDFNNILTPIMSSLSMAKMYGDLDDEIAEMLTDAEKASLRAKGLTQQLLTFAKGGEPIKMVCPISRFLKDTAKFALSGSNVKCQFVVPENLWMIEADELQMSQVIQNIVINADQAMPEGGIIRIRAENVILRAGEHATLTGGKYVRISIADQGDGIAEKKLSKIFDPFFTTKEKGRGLGLSISFTILNRHNGHIDVASEVGLGTTFHLYLPVSEKAYTAKDREESRTFTGQGKILLIDDEDMVRKSTAEILRRLGYKIDLAKDGREGIALYRNAIDGGKPFDAVIMDLTIPGGMGGKDAVQNLLKIDPEAKVLVSSGYSNDPVISEFRKYGFCGVVPKPYRSEELGEALLRVISR